MLDVHICTILVEALELGRVEISVLLAIALERNLNSIVIGNGNVERSDKFRNLNGIGTLIVGQSSIVAVVQSLYTYTGQRSLGSSIVYLTRNLLHFVFWRSLFLCICSRGWLNILDIGFIMSGEYACTRQHKETNASTQSTLN
ncbi:hypothetical protein EVA_16433 [gut metagenome]|uniref:Uncharacterized protein n=1 Tax=gut metagenome TaxID=749906 RepID=J9FKN6_9ZZZZ